VVVDVKLIVGLGNPGELYRVTRHNIGYVVIDYLAQCCQITLRTRHLSALLGHGAIGGNDIVLAKPETFMNLSGDAVRAIACFYQLSAEDIIVIHDDIDLEFGRIKIKAEGGSGGHRGVASICAALLKDTFIRIRLGIGRPPLEHGATEFVLQPFTDAEQQQLSAIITSAAQCLEIVVSQGTAAAMNTFHNKTAFPAT
jgi:PTH1 family peptidyl-tRNA hydrolase